MGRVRIFVCGVLIRAFSDEVMYLDFIQLHDVYNYLYARRVDDKSKAADKDSKGKAEVAAPVEPQGEGGGGENAGFSLAR